MKQLLVVAIMLSTATSFATRSRMSALGESMHIGNDSARLQLNPALIFYVADSVTLESGVAQTTAASGSVTTGAEATLVRTMGDAKLGLVLGHDDRFVAGLRQGASAAFLQQNPVELTYGTKMADLNVAGTLVYSKYNDKKQDQKEDTTLLRLGAVGSNFNASVSLSLVDKVTSGTSSYKGGSNFNAVAGYSIDADLYTYALVGMNGFKNNNGTTDTADFKSSYYSLGVVHSVKNDGSEFFYGASLFSTKNEESVGDTKESTLTLPVIVGIEANAASWLVLRGSVTQNVLISDSKEEDATSTTEEFAPGANTTSFAAGAGLKFNKVTIDGSLLAGTQSLNANNLLGTVALSYAF